MDGKNSLTTSDSQGLIPWVEQVESRLGMVSSDILLNGYSITGVLFANPEFKASHIPH